MVDKIAFEDVMAMVDNDITGAVEDKMSGWLARGDGIAVYENVELGHPQLGHLQFVSFGSVAALIEETTPPQRMPDIGSQINWRYQLKAICTPS